MRKLKHGEVPSPRPVVAWILALAIVAAGCAGTRPRPPHAVLSSQVSQTSIDAALAGDARVDSLIQPYRAIVESQMDEVLATCPLLMDTGKPEGLLGALVADIVLARARQASALPIAACVLNNGGLRIPWPAGEITLSMVYEVMPFDNEIVLLRLTGAQVRTLADELAAAGGEPVSGLAFLIRDGAARDLRIGDAPPGEGDYWVATSDYLAGGGGRLETLWSPQESRPTGVLVRDAIVDALRGAGSIAVPALGRIRK